MCRSTIGSVAECIGGMDPLVYLGTTVDRLAGLGLPMLFTDRNAVLETAHFTHNKEAW